MRSCVTCGSGRVRRQRVDVHLVRGGNVKGVEADVCLACGETVYDLKAMAQIDDARVARRARPSQAT